MLHHAAVVTSYLTVLYCGFGGYANIIGLMFGEISNLPMHVRNILRTYNLKFTKIYDLTEVIYLYSYVIARAIIIPFLCIYIF